MVFRLPTHSFSAIPSLSHCIAHWRRIVKHDKMALCFSSNSSAKQLVGSNYTHKVHLENGGTVSVQVTIAYLLQIIVLAHIHLEINIRKVYNYLMQRNWVLWPVKQLSNYQRLFLLLNIFWSCIGSIFLPHDYGFFPNFASSKLSRIFGFLWTIISHSYLETWVPLWL